MVVTRAVRDEFFSKMIVEASILLPTLFITPLLMILLRHFGFVPFFQQLVLFLVIPSILYHGVRTYLMDGQSESFLLEIINNATNLVKFLIE